MIIRKATEEDVDGVKKIVDSFQVSREQENWEKVCFGFFEYEQSRENLLGSLNPYFLVAGKDAIKGFILGYDCCFLRENHPKISDEEKKFLLKQKEKFLYFSQAGVLNPHSLGAGKIICELFDKEKKLAKGRGLDKIISFIPEHPWCNERSKNFLDRKGFKKFDKIYLKKEIILGAYELVL